MTLIKVLFICEICYMICADQINVNSTHRKNPLKFSSLYGRKERHTSVWAIACSRRNAFKDSLLQLLKGNSSETYNIAHNGLLSSYVIQNYTLYTILKYHIKLTRLFAWYEFHFSLKFLH
jgi:hypothetical protein